MSAQPFGSLLTPESSLVLVVRAMEYGTHAGGEIHAAHGPPWPEEGVYRQYSTRATQGGRMHRRPNTAAPMAQAA